VVSESTWEILHHWLQTNEFILPSREDEESDTENNNRHKKSAAAATPQNIAKSPIPWEMGGQKRQVAQFGFRFNYESSQVEFSGPQTTIPEIPLPLRHLLLDDLDQKLDPVWKVLTLGSFDPNIFIQCIINVYQAVTIIPWHLDHIDFGPIILVFTFGEDRPLPMRRLKSSNKKDQEKPADPFQHRINYPEDAYDYYTATPNHRSCYILSGQARDTWEHAVPTGSGLRVSITFRSHKQ
jgi:alkylated DNA repair dioxygenase AlkB